MGETRVDLQHLLEDLRDAYTGALEETILTEVIANALDSGATAIRLLTNPADATLTIADDGRGMQRRELARYHDVATSTKRRGEGIGFAGVGIKLGLLVSREVVTETRRGATHVATRWHLATRHRAPWKWIPPPGLISARGTAVRLALINPLSPLLDAGYVEEAIRRHFEPLLGPEFASVLQRHYPAGIAFEVDGRAVRRHDEPAADRASIAIRLGRRRLPSAIGVLERLASPPDGRTGIAISTYGKVITRGWEWLGLTPPAGAHVIGTIEAPDLAACLTLSKSDFVRTGPRGATYLAYRKAIQEVVSRQLAAWGETADTDARPKRLRLERDIERVLEDLTDAFPLLRSLVDRRAGGQKRLPMPGRGADHVPAPLYVAEHATRLDADGMPAEAARPDRPPVPSNAATDMDASPPDASPPHPLTTSGNRGGATGQDGPSRAEAGLPADPSITVPGRRRRGRYGLQVQFESRHEDPEPARLVDSTIWINDAHPAFTRASAARSLGYHTALAVALALAPLAVEAQDEHGFLTRFLAQWGSAGQARTASRRRRHRAR
jgi:hypothetical protein